MRRSVRLSCGTWSCFYITDRCFPLRWCSFTALRNRRAARIYRSVMVQHRHRRPRHGPLPRCNEQPHYTPLLRAHSLRTDDRRTCSRASEVRIAPLAVALEKKEDGRARRAQGRQCACTRQRRGGRGGACALRNRATLGAPCGEGHGADVNLFFVAPSYAGMPALWPAHAARLLQALRAEPFTPTYYAPSSSSAPTADTTTPSLACVDALLRALVALRLGLATPIPVLGVALVSASALALTFTALAGLAPGA